MLKSRKHTILRTGQLGDAVRAGVADALNERVRAMYSTLEPFEPITTGPPQPGGGDPLYS